MYVVIFYSAIESEILPKLVLVCNFRCLWCKCPTKNMKRCNWQSYIYTVNLDRPVSTISHSCFVCARNHTIVILNQKLVNEDNGMYVCYHSGLFQDILPIGKDSDSNLDPIIPLYNFNIRKRTFLYVLYLFALWTGLVVFESAISSIF